MTLQVVVGGQYGSEAKGHVAGWLALHDQVDLAIRVAGPNAGHSVVHPDTGVKYALRHVPAAAVTNPNTKLAIAAGSEIDFTVLGDEIRRLEGDGIKVRERLLIDSNATVLTGRYIKYEDDEKLTERIGSTSKGVGAARAQRIWRAASTVGQMQMDSYPFGNIGDVSAVAALTLKLGDNVQIEGTQGYGLGLHGPHYPYCTSSDCTAIDFLAMARVNPWSAPTNPLQIWVVFRPYPIRVAGNSGPLWEETTWEKLGLPPEYTTVTNKMRRVGQWDSALAAAAVAANGGSFGGAANPVRIAITMADQLDPALAGCCDPDQLLGSTKLVKFIQLVARDTNHAVSLVTTSDRTAVDLR